MPAELKVNDSGTWRTITELKVNDAGTWRTIQDVKVNDAGTWRTVYENVTFSATMTQGSSGGIRGYRLSPAFGSMTSVTLSSGKVIELWADLPSDPSSTINISGFSSDPGQAYIQQFTAHGTTKTSASAFSYGYSAGVATWTWLSVFGLDTSGTTSCSIP